MSNRLSLLFLNPPPPSRPATYCSTYEPTLCRFPTPSRPGVVLVWPLFLLPFLLPPPARYLCRATFPPHHPPPAPLTRMRRFVPPLRLCPPRATTFFIAMPPGNSLPETHPRRLRGVGHRGESLGGGGRVFLFQEFEARWRFFGWPLVVCSSFRAVAAFKNKTAFDFKKQCFYFCPSVRRQ